MQSGFEKFGRKSKRELFLEEMDRIVPWSGLVELIQPHYPKGEQGRPPVGLERMLRLYFLQQWFNLSDPGLEDALYESPVLRLFAGIDLGREPAPDETTILHFRHLLEKHDLGRKMLKMVNEYLALCGVRVSTGTIVDATIIHAPSSTKNGEGKRDPEMHQVKKGNQWYFGMKAHDDLEGERPLPDPELNLLTIVALLVGIPIAVLLYRSKMYGAMLVPAILGTALAVFWILRGWSAIMVARMHRRTVDALRDLITEARKDGPR